MADTTYEDIYPVFLRKITAYDLMKLEVDLREDIMAGYLETAILEFSSCNNADKINKAEKKFDVELTAEEINIIAEFMVSSWIDPFLLRDSLLKTHLTTKEYSEASQNKLIEQLVNVSSKINSKTFRLVNKYNCRNHKFSKLNRPE